MKVLVAVSFVLALPVVPVGRSPRPARRLLAQTERRLADQKPQVSVEE